MSIEFFDLMGDNYYGGKMSKSEDRRKAIMSKEQAGELKEAISILKNYNPAIRKDMYQKYRGALDTLIAHAESSPALERLELRPDIDDEKYDDFWPEGSLERFIWERCQTDNRCVREIMRRIVETFGVEKREGISPLQWFTTKNPLLGNVSPIEMIKNGRQDKLCKFILNAVEENTASLGKDK